MTPSRLVVLGDSFTFHGPDGPVPLHEPRLYPNVLRDRLAAATDRDWDVAVIARAGWSVRDVWLALQKDVYLQQRVLVGAEAVVLGVGSFDWVPVGVPTPVRALLPYVRPTELRRRLRILLDRHHHVLVRATGGRIVRTPDAVFAHNWRKSVEGIRLFAPQAALCALEPGVHRAPYYGYLHPHHARGLALTRRLGAETGVPLVDLPAIGARHLDGLNVDGIHWSWAQHAEVAAAMAEALLAQATPDSSSSGSASNSAS
jgi:lysophospholipase L1-like esterase